VNWYLNGIHDGVVDPTLDLFSHVTQLHLIGYVGGHCDKYCYVAGSQGMSLCDVKFGVWCAVSATRIVGPIFLFLRP